MTTHQVIIMPSAIAVGLSGEQVALCHEVFGAKGLRVHALDDTRAAAERIPRVLPQLVVASASLSADGRERVEDVAVAVGAVFVVLGLHPDYVAIERQLEAAVGIARERFGRTRG